MKKTRNVVVLTALVAGGVLLSGCSSVTDPDQVGLYYMQGSSDGNKFGHCTKPGQTDDYEWNNEIIYLPASLRTWTINKVDGADSQEPVIVSAAPQDGQPSGIPVKVWSQTKFYLNTFCDDNGGVVKEFWEKVGRRYGANTEDGWRRMLNDLLVSTLQKVTRDVIRTYPADRLVGNIEGVQTKAQGEIATLFAAELNRMAGGAYFCGPSFNRASKDCPAVELSIIDIDFADDGIQAARNEKQKAVEEAAAKLARAQGEAAALVAEAKGKADAAKELAKLYATPAWVALQKEIIQQQALIEACKVAKECRLIVGADGNLIIG